MRKLLAVLALVLFMVIFAVDFFTMAKAEEIIIIKGYESGQFAIRGSVGEQIKMLIADIKAKQQKMKGKLQIKVIGSADSIGAPADNDRLSRDRAEAVREELAGYFSEAQITAVPQGDQENIRQVKVIYSIMPLPEKIIEPKILVSVAPIEPQIPAAVPEEKQCVVGYGFGFGLLILTVILFFLKRKKAVKIEVKKEKAEDKKKTDGKTLLYVQPSVDWVQAGNFQVGISMMNGVYYTPFMTLEDREKPLFRAVFRDAKRAARSCVEDPRYADQISGLIAAGKIKK